MTVPTPANRPAVLVLGANGRFGSAAAQAFDAAGWRVVAQVRRAASPVLPRRAEVLNVPLTDTDALVSALGAGGRRVVVHAVNPAYTRWDEEAMPAVHAGLAVARKAKAHVMLPGNVYNYGEAMPPRLTEDTPFRPTNAKGRLRVEMEATLARAARDGGVTASVIRAGDFLGPGTGTWLDQVIAKSLRAGKLVYPGPLDVPHAWAYVPDLARAFVHAAEQPDRPAFQSLNFEGHTLTGAQLLEAIEDVAASMGLRPDTGFRVGTMPWGLIAAVGWVYPLWGELARMSYLWRVPHALVGGRTGPEPLATPLPVALADCLRAWVPAAARVRVVA